MRHNKLYNDGFRDLATNIMFTKPMRFIAFLLAIEYNPYE